LPASSNGFVTFGSVNTLMKISPKCTEAWCEILRGLPGSRLIMQSSGLGDPETRSYVEKQFAATGIDRARIELHEHGPFMEFLNLFNRIDIALDAFPYSSGTTTCHTLWMGVPIVSLAGRLAVNRMGLSVLSNLGLLDCVATDEQQYVQKAMELAADLPRLAKLRQELRDRVRSSPLTDGPRFTRYFEAALRQMWQRWCAGNPPEHINVASQPEETKGPRPKRITG
jgi:predicted O-linked N-acetylglucosamine transferase (SPINDLY family)